MKLLTVILLSFRITYKLILEIKNSNKIINILQTAQTGKRLFKGIEILLLVLVCNTVVTWHCSQPFDVGRHGLYRISDKKTHRVLDSYLKCKHFPTYFFSFLPFSSLLVYFFWNVVSVSFNTNKWGVNLHTRYYHIWNR